MDLAYKYRNSVSTPSPFDKSVADKRLERDLKLEEFKQAGALALEDRNQAGQTFRAGMNNTNNLAVADRNQFGETGRTVMTNANNLNIANLREGGDTRRAVMDNANRLTLANLRESGENNRLGISEGGLNARNTATLTQRQNEFNRSQGLEEFKAFDVNDEFGSPTNSPKRSEAFTAYLKKGQYQDRLSRIPVPGKDSLAPSHANTLTQNPTALKKVAAAPTKPFGADFLQSNLGTYSGLRGAAYLNDRIINEPLRQTYDASKRFGKWLLQRNE